MRLSRVVVVTVVFAVACGTLVSAAEASGRSLRMNQVQLLGTHNSYHRELSFVEKELQGESDPDNLWYSHASLPVQFGQQNVRQIELDVMPDSDEGGLHANPIIRRRADLGPLTDPDLAKPGIKVLHWANTRLAAAPGTCSYLRVCQGFRVIRW